ncbi:MAG: hypothetical protein EOP00_21175 [Pedobacter sp.]|nr:MAG: hypothetical protein EOP00_21175 [Pedobacter sp.]
MAFNHVFSKQQKQNRYRFLAAMSLLIFFMPFFRTCSDKEIKSGSVLIKSARSGLKTKEEKEIAFQKAKKDFSVSGYDIALSLEPETLGFTAIMILNITMLVCFLRRHYNLLLLCFLNLFIIISSIVALILMLPGFGQIRYGMYLCLVNSILLFYFVYKEQETPYNRRHKKLPGFH